MEDKNLKYNQIEDYLAGKLSGESLKAFEAKLKTNPAFAEELELHREVQTHLNDKAYLNMEQKISSIAQNYKNKKANEKKFRSRTLRIAAVAAGILLVLAFVFLIPKFTATQSPQQLFAAQYETPQLLTISRNNNNIEEIRNKAYRAYEASNFNQANEFFTKYSEQGKLPMEDQFYWAITYLSKKPSDSQTAIGLFQNIIDHGNNAYLDPAKWYMALAYLKEADIAKSKVLLQELKNSKNQKYKQAVEKLLPKL